jgi:hypothetical protein
MRSSRLRILDHRLRVVNVTFSRNVIHHVPVAAEIDVHPREFLFVGAPNRFIRCAAVRAIDQPVQQASSWTSTIGLRRRIIDGLMIGAIAIRHQRRAFRIVFILFFQCICQVFISPAL